MLLAGGIGCLAEAGHCHAATLHGQLLKLSLAVGAGSVAVDAGAWHYSLPMMALGDDTGCAAAVVLGHAAILLEKLPHSPLADEIGGFVAVVVPGRDDTSPEISLATVLAGGLDYFDMVAGAPESAELCPVAVLKIAEHAEPMKTQDAQVAEVSSDGLLGIDCTLHGWSSWTEVYSEASASASAGFPEVSCDAAHGLAALSL